MPEVKKENYTHLNRLEAHLLKLIIPFIRIARCGRGNYLKVKGDLILISSDVAHSLNKILPIQQELIPVRFKRKLSYHGSYIEEFIDKQKVEIYFKWLKKHNFLYKDVQLDKNLIDVFEKESMFDLQNFENLPQESEDNCEDEEIQCSDPTEQ